MTLHLRDLVISDRSNAISRRDLHKLHLVKIRRGVFLPMDLIPEHAPPWQIRRTVTQARALALTLAKNQDHPPVLTLEAALALHDLPTWINTPSVFYRADGRGTGRAVIKLSAATVHGVEICGVGEAQIHSSRFTKDHDEIGEVLLAPLWEIAIDCARYLHPLAALVGASAAMHRLVRFDKHDQERPRRKEAQYKQEMLDLMQQAPRFRNSVRAKRIIEIADAGMDTPGEGYVLWLLHCIVENAANGNSSGFDLERVGSPTHNRNPRGATEIFSQYEILTNGRQYFVDLAIPSLRIAIEFDGGEKIQQSHARIAFLERQRDLADAGWDVIRVDSSMLNRPASLISYLSRRLAAHGIPLHRPQGALWSPIPTELLDPKLRH